jgi:hypothetical protein
MRIQLALGLSFKHSALRASTFARAASSFGLKASAWTCSGAILSWAALAAVLREAAFRTA